MMCLGVPGIVACCKLEMACFPEERDKKMIIKKRRISASDGWMSPKQQGPDGLSVCSWVQRRIHLHWIEVICRALNQSAAGLWPHIVLDLCLSMCVREVKKGGMEVSLGQHFT